MQNKEVLWVGSSKKDLTDLPDGIRGSMGFGLFEAQQGLMPKKGKVLKGFGNAGVIEIIAEDSNGTYRTVYTINIGNFIFVLHVFQKKSKTGIKTPKKEIDLIINRIHQAKELYKERVKK
jgi:phage-related protein